MRNRTKLLQNLIDACKNADTSSKTFAPVKKRDSEDNSLGILPTELQKIWVVKEEFFQDLDTLVQKTIDLLGCFHEDLVEHKGDIPEWVLSKYMDGFNEIVPELKRLHKKFIIINNIFWSLVDLEFQREPEMPFFAIRSGYTVHCRKNNSRNDRCDPLDRLIERLGVSNKQTTMLAVEIPEGIDPSKLSPREILKAVLKQMN